MAKEFFKDLPDTTTPLTASRLNGLLDGEEALGNLVVDSIRSKNMLDVRGIEQKTNNGVTCTYDSSTNIITLNGTVTSNTQANFNIPSAIGMKLKRLTKYTASVFYISGTASGNLKFFAQDKNHNFAGIQMEFGGSNVNSTLQFDDNLIITAGYCLIRAYSGQVLDNLKFKIQVEENPTTTDYMPYQDLESKDLYSTSEIMIGTWIDGKPLYRKTILRTDAITANTELAINMNISNIDVITNISGVLSSSNKQVYRQINTYNLQNTNTSISMYAQTDGYVKIYAKENWGSPNIIITLEYTKTTDV